jgi:hypothetical protein
VSTARTQRATSGAVARPGGQLGGEGARAAQRRLLPGDRAPRCCGGLDRASTLELAQLDQPLGQRYFAELAGGHMVEGLLGTWVTQVISASPDRR